jgi:hypothetical protein
MKKTIEIIQKYNKWDNFLSLLSNLKYWI